MKGDLDALMSLEERSFPGDRLSRRSLRRFLAGDGMVRVATDPTGEVLGAAVILQPRGSRRMRLYSLAVDPRARGRGVGRTLLLDVLAEAQRRGAAVVSLEVREDNAAARELYRSEGFHPSGIRPHYYADGARAMRMERIVGGAR